MDLKIEWRYKENQIVGLAFQILEKDTYSTVAIEGLCDSTPAKLLRRLNALYDKHADHLMRSGGNCKYVYLAASNVIKDGVTEECSTEEFQQRFIAAWEACKPTPRTSNQERGE